MPDNSDPQRDAIHDVLQANSPAHTERGGILTGWVVVTEWMDTEGERWLAKAHSSSLVPWSASGFHHEALYGNWPGAEDDEL